MKAQPNEAAGFETLSETLENLKELSLIHI